MSGISWSVTTQIASAKMKAVIRSEKGVEYVALLSESYDNALDEVIRMEEEGIIKSDEEVISIIE